MSQTSSRDQVERFLMPLDPQGGLVTAARMIAARAERDPKIREATTTIINWIGTLEDREEADNFIAIAYLLAVDALTDPTAYEKIKEKLQNSDRAPVMAQQAVARFTPEFMRELAAETKLRANRNPTLQRRLADATKGLGELRSQIPVPGTDDSSGRTGLALSTRDWIVICILVCVIG